MQATVSRMQGERFSPSSALVLSSSPRHTVQVSDKPLARAAKQLQGLTSRYDRPRLFFSFQLHLHLHLLLASAHFRWWYMTLQPWQCLLVEAAQKFRPII